MISFLRIDHNFNVVEVIEATVATGFLISPRRDIQVGDILTEQEKMICGIIPWVEPTPLPGSP
jgi:hypothetical protein